VRRIEAVIFDLAGTTVDHGSLVPVRAVTEVFARQGVRISDEDARRDMGLFKKDHIRKILAAPHIDLAWRMQYRRVPDEKDVEKLFAEFAPLQMDVLEQYSDVIPGVGDVAARLRDRGVKIGATTGYTRPMLEVVLRHAAAQGYAPDIALCPDDVGGGRPHPWMCLRIAIEFQLSSTAAGVKVGDTVSDIQEGLNAGMWTVGVSRTGNEVGLSADDLAALTDAERARRVQRACDTLTNAGAHYVVESAALLDSALEQIEERLLAGERP
jgi:phosphonoacetaldehyde hydrolase